MTNLVSDVNERLLRALFDKNHEATGIINVEAQYNRIKIRVKMLTNVFD